MQFRLLVRFFALSFRVAASIIFRIFIAKSSDDESKQMNRMPWSKFRLSQLFLSKANCKDHDLYTH